MKIYSILLLAAALACCVRSERYLIETKDAADGDLEYIIMIEDDLEDGLKEPVIGNNQNKND